MHQGTPLIHNRYHAVVVYDGGGGAGSDRVRYYDPRLQKIHISGPERFNRMDGTPFDPKDIFVRPWEAQSCREWLDPDNFSVKAFQFPPELMALVAGFITQRNRGTWRWDYGIQRPVISNVTPEPVIMSVQGRFMQVVKTVYGGGEAQVVTYEVGPHQPTSVPAHQVITDKFFRYVPGQVPDAVERSNSAVLRRLVEEYRLFVQGIKPTRPVVKGR